MEINLLPWRKEIISHNKNQFYGLICAVLILASGLLWLARTQIFEKVIYDEHYIHALQKATVELKTQTSNLEKNKQTFEAAHQKVSTLENLDYSRFTAIRFFNEITKLVPNGVYFNSMTRTGPVVEITGIANSNFLIAQFMKSINSSLDLATLSLKKVERTEKDFKSITEFELHIALRSELMNSQDEQTKTDFKVGGSSTQSKNIFDEKREEIRAIFLKKSLEK